MIFIIPIQFSSYLFCIKFRNMKKAKKTLHYLSILIVFVLVGCGPVVISSRPNHPPPPWFYPNRLELVRYVYFPEFRIYYDLNTRNYIYLEGNIWIRNEVLPPRYRNYNLRKSRYVRIKDYHGDNIERYHDNNSRRGRSNLDTKRIN